MQLTLKLSNRQKVFWGLFPLLYDGFNGFGDFLSFLKENIQNQVIFLLLDIGLLKLTQGGLIDLRNRGEFFIVERKHPLHNGRLNSMRFDGFN